MSSTTFSGPVTSTNGFISGSGSVLSVTASDALTNDEHAGRTILANAAAGMTLTLPAATGTGNTYSVIVQTTVTSNNLIIQAASASDVMTGVALMAADGGDTVVGFETAADTDTITMNGTTKGGIKGDKIVLQDIATGLWHVAITGSATGTEATMFSAAV